MEEEEEAIRIYDPLNALGVKILDTQAVRAITETVVTVCDREVVTYLLLRYDGLR
jgi:hypothetical protein